MMGRAKVKLEFIKNEKNRTKSFKSRTKILKKKAHELKTLCDVDVCMIIHGPSIEGRPMIVWPPNEDKMRILIESYNKQSNEDRKRRTTDLVDFLRDRNKKVEGDLVKLRKINDDVKFAPWDERYEQCSAVELREIAAFLENRLRVARSRIEEVKGCGGAGAGAQDVVDCIHRGSVNAHRYSVEGLLRTRNVQMENPCHQAQNMDSHEMKIPIPYYHQHQQLADKQALQGINQQLDHTNNQLANPMFMMLMGNNHYPQLDAENNNYMFNSYNPVYYNDLPVTGMIENAGANFSQQPPVAYYTPKMLTVPPCLQYPVVAASNFSQLSATQMEKYYDFSQTHMGNQ